MNYINKNQPLKYVIEKDLSTRGVCGLGFSITNKNNIFGKLLRVKNRCVNVSFQGRSTDIKIDIIKSEVTKAVLNQNKKKDGEWLVQETVNLLSSEVNKVIDKACIRHEITIRNKEKEAIFQKITSGLGNSVVLNPKCAQSSIWQTIHGSKYVSNKVESLYYNKLSRVDRNALRSEINTRLTELVFEEGFGGISLSVLRKNAAREVAAIVAGYQREQKQNGI